MSKSCPCAINLNISIARMPSFLPLLLVLLELLLPRLLKWRQPFRPPRNPRVATWRRRTRTKPMTTKHQYYKQQFQQLCQQQSVPPTRQQSRHSNHHNNPHFHQYGQHQHTQPPPCLVLKWSPSYLSGVWKNQRTQPPEKSFNIRP